MAAKQITRKSSGARRIAAIVFLIAVAPSDIFPGQNSLSLSAYEPYRPVDALHFRGGMIRRARGSKAFFEMLFPRLACL